MEDERAGKEDGKWKEQDRLQQASVLGFSRYLRGSHAMLASRVLESFARNEEKRPLVEYMRSPQQESEERVKKVVRG
jgi:hypothetical protein